jgi:hypothetical protein
MVEGIRKIKIEEHLSILQDPGSVGYVVPKTGSATSNTLKSIDEFLIAIRIDTVNLRGLGSDGTNTNTDKFD